LHKVYHISRIALFLIWLHHGLVPKLLFKDQQEIAMNDLLIPFLSQEQALLYTGLAEVIYAALILIFYKSRTLLIPSILFSSLVTFVLIFTFPLLFTQAFNPFSINISVLSLSVINIYTHPIALKITSQQPS